MQSVQSVTFPGHGPHPRRRPEVRRKLPPGRHGRRIRHVPPHVGTSPPSPTTCSPSCSARSGCRRLPISRSSVSGLFYPLGLVACNVLKVQCKGPLIVRLEILKKILMTLVFAVTIPHSVMAVVWGLVVIAAAEAAINCWAARRFTILSMRSLPQDPAARHAGLGGHVCRRTRNGRGHSR